MLIRLLRKEGFAATQATLSRDLTFLGIAKAPRSGGGYGYALPAEAVRTVPRRPGAGFHPRVISLEFSGSFGLIKTHPCHAQASPPPWMAWASSRCWAHWQETTRYW